MEATTILEEPYHHEKGPIRPFKLAIMDLLVMTIIQMVLLSHITCCKPKLQHK